MSCKSDVPFASCTANHGERILIPHVTLGDSSIKKQIVPPTSTSLAVSTWKIRKCFPNSKHGKEKKYCFVKVFSSVTKNKPKNSRKNIMFRLGHGAAPPLFPRELLRRAHGMEWIASRSRRRQRAKGKPGSRWLTPFFSCGLILSRCPGDEIQTTVSNLPSQPYRPELSSPSK